MTTYSEGIKIQVGMQIESGGIASMNLYEDRLEIGDFTASDAVSLIAILRDAADALEAYLSTIRH